MIAVATIKENHPAVREFFELFKTPWEFFQEGSTADVLICAQNDVPKNGARLVLIYDGQQNNFDRVNDVEVKPAPPIKIFSLPQLALPIYGKAVTSGADSPLIYELPVNPAGQIYIRLGYDLFSEIRSLLTSGQPPENAKIPTLDLHIELLRSLLLKYSAPFLEVPPVPLLHDFIVCLTHDCDHVGIRNHPFDHTLVGFVYRATIGSAFGLFSGKKSFRQCVKNLKAVLSLPFIHLGLAKDFWFSFERYAEIERGVTSTFFVIPKKGEPGTAANGTRPAKRAASYEAADLAETFKQVHAHGNEIAVHGIDAWRDTAAGRDEKDRISKLTGGTKAGVRMHWLYFDEQSPAKLEAAGYDYDSTIGYNQTIGYRAGTSQVFKPLTVEKLLELPMHIMDTAMFYPSYLNLTSIQAGAAVQPLVENAIKRGGVLTVNWHDRSVAPERLWDDFYIGLIARLKNCKAWFATATQAVAWFRSRRDVSFENHGSSIKIRASTKSGLPGMRVKIYQPDKTILELAVKDGMEISLSS